jgi:hypothetical protein
MWKLGLWPCDSFSGHICFEFSVLVLCSALIELNGIRARTYVRASSGYDLAISPHSPNVPSSAEVYPSILPPVAVAVAVAAAAAVAVAVAVAVAALSAFGTDVQPAHNPSVRI